MRRILTGTVCVALCAGTVAVGTAPANAASAKKVPVLTVKQSASKVSTGGSITFTPSLHLPAHDKLAGWTLTFGDGSKTSAKVTKVKSLPHSIKHTYKKKLSGHAVLTVTDTRKHHWSVSLPVSVVTPAFAGGGAAATGVTGPASGISSGTTPAGGSCMDPAGAVTGKVSSGGLALQGITVSISDADSSDAALAVTTTNCHGAWAVPSGVVVGPDGYDVKVNSNGAVADASSDSFAPLDPGYDVREYTVVPPGTALASDLPATAIISGVVTASSGTIPAGTVVTARGYRSGDSSILATFSPIDSTGHYRLAAGVNYTWVLVVANSGPFALPFIVGSTAPETQNISY